ncbi:MAG TPA: 50S ribosomal protein L24 [Candidatus Paceibacterota bacterium]
MIKLKIKKNDTVTVISGKDRGRRGKVIDVFPETNKMVVEGVAFKKKHQRPRKAGQKGETVTLPSPIDASNVMLYCSHCARGVRVGFVGGTKQSAAPKQRVCKKCNNAI